ncbi:MAG: hypothetical protein ACYSWP_15650 [Planctomycetota bacterium]|jgi:hypothetical protein
MKQRTKSIGSIVKDGVKAVGLTAIVTAMMATATFGKHTSYQANTQVQDRYSYNLGQSNHSPDTQDPSGYWVFPIWGGIIALGIIEDYTRRKCPGCDMKWGMKRTQTSENRYNGNWPKIFRDDWDLHRCKGCGYEEWKQRPQD